MKHTLSTLFILLITTVTASATTYYASPTGSGNGTSYSKPCSLSNGINKLSQAGDSLYLLGGQYDLDNTKISNKVGSKTAYIVISAYPGEKAILDFRTTAYGTRGLQINSGCSYLHIKDLTLRYSGKNNLYNEGSYCLFENLDIYGSADTGCQMKVGGNNTIKNVDSHDNFDYELDKSGNLTQCDFGGNADGFADKQHDGAPNHYIGCRSWNNSDDGWDFFQRITTGETIIEQCICYKNGPTTYDMRNHPRYNTDKAWFDQFTNGKTVTDADGNSVYVTLDNYPNMGNGNGFKLGGNSTVHNVLVHHCLSVANTVKGYDQNSDAGAVRLYNNTAYLNNSDYSFYNSNGCTLDIENCISFKSKSNNTFNKDIVKTNKNNTWSNGFTVSASDFQSLDTTQILAARQSDGSLSEGTLFRLASGSSLIDAGVDVGLSYMGTAPDLGCYESDGLLHPTIACTSNNEEQWVQQNSAISNIIFQWGGSATSLTCSTLPAGITSAINATARTLTLSGSPTAAGTHTISISTVSETEEVNTLTATIYVKSSSAHRIGYVTTLSCEEDKALLQWLQGSDSIVITELDATSTSNDYSPYEVLVLGPKPSSGAAAFSSLKGYDKPMLVLKPFLFKNSGWNWGTAVNTQDLSISISDTTHTLFRGITCGEEQTIQLFSSCTTNAVTAINGWTNAEVATLASPVSQSGYTTIADIPAGTALNGTTLTQRLVMIGLSEYSLAHLTDDGMRLVENAIYYLLGMTTPDRNTAVSTVKAERIEAEKVLTPNGILIHIGENYYTIMGQLVHQ